MKYLAFCLAVSLIVIGQFSPASAQARQSVDLQWVTVCPAAETDIAPPLQSAPDCQTVSGWSVDPQGDHIWAMFTLTLDDAMLDAVNPASLVVSAKASSHIYLNGQKLAANGEPADSAASEITGQMDFVVPLDPGQLKRGDNQVALRLSSHNGLLELTAPLHGIFVAPYANPQAEMLRGYWPTLLPFGAFALGALYFMVMALRSAQGLQAGLLSLMSGLAALQLLAEISRGLFAYTYPMQDLRLLVIMFCSAAFGLALAVYVLRMFDYRPLWRWLIPVALMIAAAIILPSGFDTKASFALLGPTLFASALSFAAAGRRKAFALTIGAGLAIFALINLIGAGLFLDFFFYYAVAALMLCLFAQQARAYAREQALLIEEQARADKLEFVLSERIAEPETVHISVSEAGRITQVVAEDIAYVSGAGDYAELTLKSGQTHLHSETLAQLSSKLPAYFLKVHRSHIVNTKMIERLEREASGTGTLFLQNMQTVPVSRRIMPTVREALT